MAGDYAQECERVADLTPRGGDIWALTFPGCPDFCALLGSEELEELRGAIDGEALRSPVFVFLASGHRAEVWGAYEPEPEDSDG